MNSTDAKSRIEHLEKRMINLRLSCEQLGIGDVFSNLVLLNQHEGFLDDTLYEIIDTAIAEAESSQFLSPFIAPRVSIDAGNILVGAADGKPVRISFDPRRQGAIAHLSVFGKSGSGKSSFFANLLKYASSSSYTFVVDPNRFFRRIKNLFHEFARVEHLKLNLFDPIEGVAKELINQVMISTLVESFSLVFAEYEIAEAVSELQGKGPFNWTHIVSALQQKKSQFGSRRIQYRESALLVISNLLRATFGVFECQAGMRILDVLSNNIILEVDAFLPEHSAFLIRALFEFLCLTSVNLGNLSRELLFLLDEAQVLATQKNFADKILRLRHSGVYLLMGFQNPSLSPVELIGNSDAFFCFQLTDGKDRERVKQIMRLTTEQADALATLRRGQCVAFLPRSSWQSPFLMEVPHVHQD